MDHAVQCLIVAAGWKPDPKIMSQRHSWRTDDDHDDHVTILDSTDFANSTFGHNDPGGFIKLWKGKTEIKKQRLQ